MTTQQKDILSKVKSSRRLSPDRIVLTGTEGVGKSTFAAGAPSPIFIPVEDGIGHLDVPALPVPQSLPEIEGYIETLRCESHPYRTLVIDTVDWMERLVFDDVCQRNKWKDIEEPGYGKGYAAAVDEWKRIVQALDFLRADKGMEIILIAHTRVKAFSNPSGPDFDRYMMSMNEKGAAVLKQWADAVLFACFEEMVEKQKGEMKMKGVSTGHRVIHTTRRAAWDAKNRHFLPEVLPLSYEEYAAARAAQAPASPEVLAAEFDSLLRELKPGKTQLHKILDFVGDKTDARKLAQACDRLRALIEEKAA